MTTELGKLVEDATARFHSASDWEHFIALSRAASDLAPTVNALPHPAANLLHHL